MLKETPESATLEPSGDGISWRPDPKSILVPTATPAVHVPGEFDDGTFVSHVRTSGDYIFIAHFNGLVSVWREKRMVFTITHFLEAVDRYQDGDHTIRDMQINAKRLIVGLNRRIGGATVWKFNDGNSPSVELISQMAITGPGFLGCVGIELDIAAIGMGPLPGPDRIDIWDYHQNVITRTLDCSDIETVKLKANLLLVTAFRHVKVGQT